MIYTLADNDTMIDMLVSGEFGLLNKATRADTVTVAMERISLENITMSSYPRIGLSYIGFACEKPGVSSETVRQAIAYCFDRDAVTEEYTGNFGIRVDGWFGLGQWMYRVVTGSVAPPVAAPEDENDAAAQAEYEAAMEAFEELSLDGLNPYGVDIDRARQLLEDDGWVLNSEGIREKDGTVLNLTMIYPEGNNAEESLQRNLADNLAQAGIRLSFSAVPMTELLSAWYGQSDRTADMFYMASNFDTIYDPSVSFSDGPEGEHSWAYTNLYDEELYKYAEAMRTTEQGDVLTYMQNWIAFQQRFNGILPMIPIYSNGYFDFYTGNLRNYYISENSTWGQAIVGAYISTEEEEPEETDDEDDFGEIEFD